MIAPLVMVGQWEDDREGDRDIVALLTGKKYVEVQSEVTDLAGLADPPLVKVGNRWRFSSPEEAWDLLAKSLTSSDLGTFQAVAVAVLAAAPLPVSHGRALEHLLQEEEVVEPSGADGAGNILGSVLRGLKRGWQVVGGKLGFKSIAPAGPTDGEVPPNDLPAGSLGSETMRQGMARTLVIMAMDPNRTVYEAECALLPRRVVAEVLGTTADHQVWESLGRCLAVLAEAAPEEFMGAVDAALEVDLSPFATLFWEEPGWSNSDFRYSGLFWALERLAWSEDHFARVADLVVRLGQIVDGSSAARRALECASGLFEPGIGFTDASDEARLNALERLVDRHPEAGWRVLCDTYPTSRGFLLDRSPPVWRPWGAGGARQSTRGEYFTYVAALERMVVEKVGCDPVRWKGVLDIHWFMSDYVRGSLIWLLSRRVLKLGDAKDRWTCGMKQGKRFPGTVSMQTLPRLCRHVVSKPLQQVYQELAPDDPVELFAWKFDAWPLDPEVSLWSLDIKEQQRLAGDARREAVREAYLSGGVGAILSIAATVRQPDSLALAVADGLDKEAAVELATECLGCHRGNLKEFARGVLSGIHKQFGWSELDLVLNRLRAAGAEPPALAEVFLAAPSNRSVWDRLENESETVRSAYWKGVGRWRVIVECSRDAAFAAGQLIAVQRSLAAIELLAHIGVDFDGDCAAAAVEALQRESAEQNADRGAAQRDGTFLYDISKLFEKLDKVADLSDAQIAELETAYVGDWTVTGRV